MTVVCGEVTILNDLLNILEKEIFLIVGIQNSKWFQKYRSFKDGNISESGTHNSKESEDMTVSEKGIAL